MLSPERYCFREVKSADLPSPPSSRCRVPSTCKPFSAASVLPTLVALESLIQRTPLCSSASWKRCARPVKVVSACRLEERGRPTASASASAASALVVMLTGKLHLLHVQHFHLSPAAGFTQLTVQMIITHGDTKADAAVIGTAYRHGQGIIGVNDADFGIFINTQFGCAILL